MCTLALIILQLFLVSAHAIEFNQLNKGTIVELTESLQVNKLNNGSDLQCFVGGIAIYPKITVGPRSGNGVIPLRFFTVSSVLKDAITYFVYLHSEQMPCNCVLTINQTPAYLRGPGSNFQMLIPADKAAMAKEPAIPSACGNYPEWLNQAMPFEDDETISL